MTSPRELVAAECARRGRDAFVQGCLRLVGGDYEDIGLIHALAPASAPRNLDDREHQDVYWFRVWGMRGLLWAYQSAACAGVLGGLADEHWRVREMAAKVTARYRLDAAQAALIDLRADPVLRVRAAAERALVVLAGG